MNKQIKELAKKAGGNPNYSAFRGHFLPPPPDYIDPATVDLEKFAELIVKECAHLVGGYTKENEFGTDVKEAYEEITKHFGVEE